MWCILFLLSELLLFISYTFLKAFLFECKVDHSWVWVWPLNHQCYLSVVRGKQLSGKEYILRICMEMCFNLLESFDQNGWYHMWQWNKTVTQIVEFFCVNSSGVAKDLWAWGPWPLWGVGGCILTIDIMTWDNVYIFRGHREVRAPLPSPSYTTVI